MRKPWIQSPAPPGQGTVTHALEKQRQDFEKFNIIFHCEVRLKSRWGYMRTSLKKKLKDPDWLTEFEYNSGR